MIQDDVSSVETIPERLCASLLWSESLSMARGPPAVAPQPVNTPPQRPQLQPVARRQ
jgi:hypothetical protein